MASSSSSPQLEMEQSFSIAAGDLTEAEKDYRFRKGLIYENSKDETLDISTDVESINSSNISRLDSLLIFEENERLYSSLLNRSAASSGSIVNSPIKVQNSPLKSAQSPERQLDNMSKLSLNESSVSPGYAYPISVEEEDKENEFKGPMGVQRALFQDEVKRVRDPLEEIKGVAEQSFMSDYEGSEKSQDEASELSDNEVCVIPCTQDVPHEVSIPADSDNIEVVPCTQEQNVSLNLNQTYTSVSLEDSLADDEELVPCTQAPAYSFISDGEVSRLNDSSMTSNLPCSQTSEEDTSGKVDFNDSIAYMDYLLKKADEQEEREKLAAELEKSSNPVSASPCKAVTEEQVSSEPVPISQAESSEAVNLKGETNIDDEVFFKTPLKHNRVQLLKNKKMASPSPPRSFANNLLKQRCTVKVGAQVEIAKEKKPALVRKSLTTTSASSSPIGTSTPKHRAPMTNITPGAKLHTPGRGGILKTPVAAKVDSGLRSAPFPVGLSPVAKYIYEKPVPSKFARVQSVPNPKAGAAVSVPNPLSRIPLPPARSSQANIKTPASASKQPRHSGVLRTSTYFNMTSTPPQIVANEKAVLEKKRFQPLQYMGASKVKGLNGKVESPRTNDYVAHRHTGLRDESGNASFIQNTVIQKRNIPLQSRLATPKNEIEQENVGGDDMKLWTSNS